LHFAGDAARLARVKLGTGWETGIATIVAREQAGYSPVLSARRSFAYELVADVQPDSGAPVFRATFKQPFDASIDVPDVGDQARVRFQRGGQKVELDKSDLRDAKKEDAQRERARFDEIAGAPPGSTPVPDPPAPGTPAPDTQSELSEMSATSARLSAATAGFAETMAAIKEARAAGDLAEVERLKAEFAARAPKPD
jgi:hypothetical protein